MVANPQVALVELIKNSYDADAVACNVTVEPVEPCLTIVDNGNGMTLADFKDRWMRIATAGKANSRMSARFKRPLTGAKGIGRFAVRYLGDHLKLISRAFDPHYDCITQLEAEFDWPRLDTVVDLAKTQVPYKLLRAPHGATVGTTLQIRNLRTTAEFVTAPALRADVLRIVTPIRGLDSGKFARSQLENGDADPGFSLKLPGVDSHDDGNLAKHVLSNFWARVVVTLNGSELRISVTPAGGKERKLKLNYPNSISNGFVADIRYFPRRPGIFNAKGITGKDAWSWVRSNCGVKVIDHGFHIHPYGFEKDDWLNLDLDASHNERNWRTKLAQTSFPIEPMLQGNPAENPALNLASNFQLIGAVFIETNRNLGSSQAVDLVSAMDRSGLIENTAFEQLRDCVRAGIEYLAHVDKLEMRLRTESEAKQAAAEATEEIREAIEHIQNSPTLTSGDKARITKQYSLLAKRVEEQERYTEEARSSLLAMNLLGVVAGFMTHESKAILHDLQEALAEIQQLAERHKSLTPIAKSLSGRLASFESYMEYSKLFVRKVSLMKKETLASAAQVRFVLTRFKTFADERGIAVTVNIDSDVKTPPLPVTVYSGIILNLYSNALKAVIAGDSQRGKPHITIRAWNDKTNHTIEVADNGIGIPPSLRRRIWEPLFTTTSDIGNPLGSGMGLGLTLVRQVTHEFGGSIKLIDDAPPGFNTCFRVTFPMRSKNEKTQNHPS